MMHGMYPVIGPLNSLVIWNGQQVTTRQCDIDKLCHVTQWNDLSGQFEDAENSRRDPYAIKVGYKTLYDIMQQQNIKCFIRGHQDHCPTQRGFDEDCRDTIATKVAEGRRSFKCIHKVYHDNETSYYHCKPKKTLVISRIPMIKPPSLINVLRLRSYKKDVVRTIKHHVFTTSMAYDKGYGRVTYATKGAYIVLNYEENKTHAEDKVEESSVPDFLSCKRENAVNVVRPNGGDRKKTTKPEVV
jgi:hypothetical protein